MLSIRRVARALYGSHDEFILGNRVRGTHAVAGSEQPLGILLPTMLVLDRVGEGAMRDQRRAKYLIEAAMEDANVAKSHLILSLAQLDKLAVEIMAR